MRERSDATDADADDARETFASTLDADDAVSRASTSTDEVVIARLDAAGAQNAQNVDATTTTTTTTTDDAFKATNERVKKKTTKKTYERVKLPTPEEVYQQDAMDNCAVKTAMSCALGGALGGVMGVVFGAFEPMEVPAVDAPKVTVRETIKQGLRSAGARSWSYAKGFAAFGALYAGSECAVEKARARHDVVNSAYAGCFTGGVMARSSGPSGIAFGCATMAALSVAMDKCMDHH